MPNELQAAHASSASARMIGLGFAIGGAVSIFCIVASSGTVAKITEELAAVNETIQGNAAQFSLVPYAEDPDEFRDAIDLWRGYLREVGNMGLNAILGPLDESTLVPLLGNVAIYAFFLLFPLCLFSGRWAAAALALLLAPVFTGALAVVKLLAAMAWVNQGLMTVVGDLRVGAMEKLLAGSNHNDDFLQAMLLATGHLTNIDESPFWLCVPLPWPLNFRLPTVKAASHGGAWTEGCVCVTWEVLSALTTLLALLLPTVLFRVMAAVRRGDPTSKAPRVRIQE